MGKEGLDAATLLMTLLTCCTAGDKPPAPRVPAGYNSGYQHRALKQRQHTWAWLLPLTLTVTAESSRYGVRVQGHQPLTHPG